VYGKPVATKEPEPVAIDIVIPFYGRFDHLRAAVDSVRAQSSPDWRLIVIDDVYPDLAPGEWISAIDDERIFYVRNEKNLGVGGNFRMATTFGSAPRKVIMGCDDVMLPGYVERIEYLDRAFPGSAILQPGVRIIDEDGRSADPLPDRVKRILRVRGAKPARYHGEKLARSLIRGNWTYFPSLCWDSALFEKYAFREDLDVVLDLALQLEIIEDGGTMVVDDMPVFLYRRHSSSVSSAKAVDGSRFAQESLLFRESRARFASLGWNRASRTAALHLSSRLNALLQLSRAWRSSDRVGSRLLLRHAFIWAEK
jgi:glycosyltransferase involved in cell wall biosynthesis